MIKESEEFKKLKEIANKIVKEYNEKNRFNALFDYKTSVLNSKKVISDILVDNNIALNDNEIQMLTMLLRDYKYNLLNKPSSKNPYDISFTKEQVNKAFEKTGYSKDACILASLHEYTAFEDMEEYNTLLRVITYYLSVEANIDTIVYITFNLGKLVSIEDVSNEIRTELYFKELEHSMSRLKVKLPADYIEQIKSIKMCMNRKESEK